MARFRSFYRGVKIVRVKDPEDSFTNTTATYPGTTYIDVSNYKYFDVLIHAGALTNALSCSIYENTASTGGTLDAVDATYAKATLAAADDGQCLLFHVDTEHLASGHHYVAVKVNGAGAGDYGDVLFFLHGAKSMPVAQSATYIPTAHVKTLAG